MISIFGRKKAYQDIESVIAQGVEIKGEIISQGSLRIDGGVDGKLNVKGDIILGEKGRIKGEIKVDNLIVAGRVEGNVVASGRFEIAANGYFKGDVTCSILTIEEGGVLDGNSRMVGHISKPDFESRQSAKRQQENKTY
ncbi:MAG: bactofilin family protein [Deltaproteobacteria bacterium]